MGEETAKLPPLDNEMDDAVDMLIDVALLSVIAPDAVTVVPPGVRKFTPVVRALRVTLLVGAEFIVTAEP